MPAATAAVVVPLSSVDPNENADGDADESPPVHRDEEEGMVSADDLFLAGFWVDHHPARSAVKKAAAYVAKRADEDQAGKLRPKMRLVIARLMKNHFVDHVGSEPNAAKEEQWNKYAEPCENDHDRFEKAVFVLRFVGMRRAEPRPAIPVKRAPA